MEERLYRVAGLCILASWASMKGGFFKFLEDQGKKKRDLHLGPASGLEHQIKLLTRGSCLGAIDWTEKAWSRGRAG